MQAVEVNYLETMVGMIGMLINIRSLANLHCNSMYTKLYNNQLHERTCERTESHIHIILAHKSDSPTGSFK